MLLLFYQTGLSQWHSHSGLVVNTFAWDADGPGSSLGQTSKKLFHHKLQFYGY